MNKEEILEALELKDAETLEALYMISNVFSKEELKKVSIAVQDKNNRLLINEYL